MNVTKWLNDTISTAAFTAGGTFGDGSYAAPVTEKARVQFKQEFVRNAQGEEVMSTSQIYKLNAIAMNDRVWLPGLSSSDASLARVPLAIAAANDKVGKVIFYKVWL